MGFIAQPLQEHRSLGEKVRGARMVLCSDHLRNCRMDNLVEAFGWNGAVLLQNDAADQQMGGTIAAEVVQRLELPDELFTGITESA